MSTYVYTYMHVSLHPPQLYSKRVGANFGQLASVAQFALVGLMVQGPLQPTLYHARLLAKAKQTQLSFFGAD